MTDTMPLPAAKKFGFCACGAKRLLTKLKDGKCQTCRILALHPAPQPEPEPAAAEPIPKAKKKFVIYREEIHLSKVEVVADDKDEALEACQDFDAGEQPPEGCHVLWTKPCCLNFGEAIAWQIEEGGEVLQESDGLNVKELIAKDKQPS